MCEEILGRIEMSIHYQSGSQEHFSIHLFTLLLCRPTQAGLLA